jgi:hypothetical protein
MGFCKLLPYSTEMRSLGPQVPIELRKATGPQNKVYRDFGHLDPKVRRIHTTRKQMIPCVNSRIILRSFHDFHVKDIFLLI